MNPIALHRLQYRYARFKLHEALSRQGSSPALAFPLALVHLLYLTLSWIIFPLEGSFWRSQRARRLYPQISMRLLHPLDPLRMVIQSIFNLLFAPQPSILNTDRRQRLRQLGNRIETRVSELFERAPAPGVGPAFGFLGRLKSLPGRTKTAAIVFLCLFAIAMATVCITQPFGVREQLTFFASTMLLAMLLARSHRRLTTIMLFIITVLISARYIWWRYTQTLDMSTPASTLCGLLLLGAETYAFTVACLGYFQVCWPLERKPYPLPRDRSLWPTVDVYIPTYNEPLEVVRPTVFAAQSMDWPSDKLRVYILDDGSRQEFREFAQQAGAGYIIRDEHKHAKAGNINHALTLTHGEFICIFDCDHIATRAFLQMTMGWFLKDPKIALLQTPHHFYSQDPFEKNLRLSSTIPCEQSFFHDFAQKGNDTWNATMFCGSCAVIRRAPLERIGGIAVETVTEDAHTSLKLNRLGYRSAFLSLPLSAGLSPETVSSHIGQRIRWARGLVQVFRLDNPLFGRGLSLAQRIIFLVEQFYFFYPLPRLIYMLAPIPFLLFDVTVIWAESATILCFIFPYMIHSLVASREFQRGYRYPLLNGLYEAVTAWYLVLPTVVALICPSKGKFNVTAKGGIINKTFLDWQISRPYLIILMINLIGFAFGVYKLILGTTYGWLPLVINLGWVLYNLIILFASVAVTVETIQVRRYPRVPVSIDTTILTSGRLALAARIADYSQRGTRVRLTDSRMTRFIRLHETVRVVLSRDGVSKQFPMTVMRIDEQGFLGLELNDMSMASERAYVQHLFGRADTWSKDRAMKRPTSFVGDLATLLNLAVSGSRAIIAYAPAPLQPIFKLVSLIFGWVVSFVPRLPIIDRDESRVESP